MRVEWSKRDRYRKGDKAGRILGNVYVGEVNVNRELVVAGLAWRYRYARRPDFDKLETEARAAKRGLWSDPHAIDPWQFRQDEKEKSSTRMPSGAK